ncbi:MAG: hypothetical protein GXY77_11290 [Fibrobacter sp.]|nr:hypothetical protein [Fibrobacter sp.]
MSSSNEHCYDAYAYFDITGYNKPINIGNWAKLRSFMEKDPAFNLLPVKSWFLSLSFKLATPLICKDDEIFSIENEVLNKGQNKNNYNLFHKDKTMKVPFYPASSWKGRLRWVAYKKWLENGKSPEDRFQLSLLFGEESGDEEGKRLSEYLDKNCGEQTKNYRDLVRSRFKYTNDTEKEEKEQSIPHHAGNLYFYPSYFDTLGESVINPHDREKKAGKYPIKIENVPKGTTGRFKVLFSPLYTGKGYSFEDMNRGLKIIIESVHDMFRVYGFGAKTSSGFGAVENINCGSVSFKFGENKLDNRQFSDLEEMKKLPEIINMELKQ